MDDEYEYVSLVKGGAGDDVWADQVTTGGVRSLGALLRQVHDATRDWVAPGDACWSVPHGPGAVICHGDPKPGNFAWRDGQAVGLFDWDAARPGDTRDDVAYALLWVIPVNAAVSSDHQHESVGVAAKRARAQALLEGYGWEGDLDVVEATIKRHERAIDEVQWLGQLGHEPHATWLAEDWPARWRDQIGLARSVARRAFPAGSWAGPH